MRDPVTGGEPAAENLRGKTMKSKKRCRLLTGCLILFINCTSLMISADPEHGDFARQSEMSSQKSVSTYGMTPISGEFIKDGTWEIEMRSSSQFFRAETCELIAVNGELTARITMSTYSYTLLYMGTAEEAAAAPYEDYIEYEDIDDWYVFEVPVRALNTPIDCASYSKRKKKWYSRKLLFEAASLDEAALDGIRLPDYELIEKAVALYEETEEAEASAGGMQAAAGAETLQEDAEGEKDAGSRQTEQSALGGYLASDDPSYNIPMELDLKDGRYSINVDMTGGSGRAQISTPTLLIVEDGKAYARLLWSSTYYDWMSVGGTVYENETIDGGNSTFTIPVSAMDSLIPVVADTTAMGDPVPIEYTLTFYRESIGDEGLIPQEAAKKVVLMALILIVGGFFLNLGLKNRKHRRRN